MTDAAGYRVIRVGLRDPTVSSDNKVGRAGRAPGWDGAEG